MTAKVHKEGMPRPEQKQSLLTTRQRLLKTRSLPSIAKLHWPLDSSLHVHRGADDDSLSSLDDPDDWRRGDKSILIRKSDKDPKACRLLISRAQRSSLENSESHLSLLDDTPEMPYRRNSLVRNERFDNVTGETIERLQRLSMSAPNLRFNMSSLEFHDDNDDEETQQITVVTPTLRRNPDREDRGTSKSPGAVGGEDSHRCHPRIPVDQQQTQAISSRVRRNRHRSASPTIGQSHSNSRSGMNGNRGRRRNRIKVKSMSSADNDGANGADYAILQFEPDEDSPTRTSNQLGREHSRNQGFVRRPLVRSDSKGHSSISPYRTKMIISRQKLIQKLVDGGYTKEEHKAILSITGFGDDMTYLNRSAEF